MSGWSEQHQRLAERLADFESTESAVLFPSGYAACSGTVATLAERGDLLLSDQLNHASLIDGCRLAAAERVIFPHRDVAAVESVLKARRDRFHRVWIVTDAVFSMDGHVAPLRQLCDIADRYEANVMVDEAHATGVLGERGRGLCEQLGVKDRIAIRIGTLSKAIGSQGGFVAAPQPVIEYLINRCRPLIYSTSLAPASVSAAIAGLDIIDNEPQRRAVVQQLARRLRNRLGIAAEAAEASVPIIPIELGADAEAVRASEMLAEQGFFVPAIRPPTVPEGRARLRISLSVAHDQSTVERLAANVLRILEKKGEMFGEFDTMS